jgi:hypothetical protein
VHRSRRALKKGCAPEKLLPLLPLALLQLLQSLLPLLQQRKRSRALFLDQRVFPVVDLLPVVERAGQPRRSQRDRTLRRLRSEDSDADSEVALTLGCDAREARHSGAGTPTSAALMRAVSAERHVISSFSAAVFSSRLISMTRSLLLS